MFEGPARSGLFAYAQNRDGKKHPAKLHKYFVFMQFRRVQGTQSSKLTAYKKVIDGLVFVSPRQIPVTFAQGQTEVGILERPLRASTPQGERVALARSEMINAGASIAFDLTLLDSKLEPAVREWFDYGTLRGLGQWRTKGRGTFTQVMTELVG